MSINEKVISKFIQIHGFVYNYSLVEYVNNVTKILVICQTHGYFEITPHHHKRGGGCQKCAIVGVKSLSNSDFINKSNKIHNNKYDYSMVDYKRNRDKVNILCIEHGLFEQNAGAHLRGQGCPTCGIKFTHRDILISRFKNKHQEKYKYFFNREKYKYSDYIDIECIKHGKFKQRVMNHLSGSGCQKCGGSVFNNFDFIEKSKHIHNNKYDYSLVNYKKFNIPVCIICNKHGIFSQKPVNHISGSGCQKCNESKGEIIIRNYLLENNIKFESQKKFGGCVNKRELPFDFYLTDLNCCIEYNGVQHYEPVECFGGVKNLLNISERDDIKENYCKSNGINLIIIPYTEILKIYTILDNFLK
jgi:hypothetical protein